VNATAEATPISLLDAALFGLDQCEWGDCPEPATVYHLASECSFCARHFRKTEEDHAYYVA
jgi:hypothetical protein